MVDAMKRGPALDVGRRFEEALHLLLAQHERRFARLLHGRQMASAQVYRLVRSGSEARHLLKDLRPNLAAVRTAGGPRITIARL